MDSDLHSDAANFEHPCCHLPAPDRLVFDPTQLTQGGDQSRLRHILIGHPEAVNQEVLNLYHCGYAINGWSPPQMVPDTGEVVRIYTKRSRRGSGWSDRPS